MTAPPEWPAQEAPAMPAAAGPSRAGNVVVAGLVLSVVLVALGVALLREVLVVQGGLSGTPWVPAVLDAAEGREASIGSSVLGGLALVAGVWLVVVALRPRIRRSLRLGSPTGVWIGRTDVARLATRAALDVDGVVGARTRVGPRTVTVTVRTLGASKEIVAAVTASVEPMLLPVVGIGVRVVARRA